MHTTFVFFVLINIVSVCEKCMHHLCSKVDYWYNNEKMSINETKNAVSFI